MTQVQSRGLLASPEAGPRAGGARAVRLARGFAAALVSTLVAAVSHAAGGGLFPSPALLLAGLAFATLFCVALAGRRVSWPRLVPAVGVSQLLFHLVFSMAAGPVLAVAGSHGQHEPLVTSEVVVVTHGHPYSWMLVAHLLAWLVTVIALRYGEVAFWGLFAPALNPLSFLFRFAGRMPVPTVAHPSLAVLGAGFHPRRMAVFLTSLRHRGPPRVAVCA